ncbi:hypothetical protein LINPERPRIM_LOCUS33362 [Linum perenne]
MSRARYQFKKLKVEKDDSSFLKIGHGSKGTSKVKRLKDSYTVRDEEATTMKSKIRKTSVSHTLAVDIIDLEEDSDVLDNKCKTSVSPTPEVDIIDLEEDLDDVVNKCLPGSLVQNLRLRTTYLWMLLSNEVLVQNAHCFCDRGSMWSLLPGKWVDNFKLVLEHGWTPQKVIDEYKNNILLTADKCKKVKFMGELFNILYAKGESSETVPKVADFEIKVPSFVPKQCNT